MPTIQQQIVQVSKEAIAEFYRYLLAIPQDKLEWQPMEVGQTALDMAREIAVTPIWALQAMGYLPITTEDRAAIRNEMESWLDVATCQAKAQENLEKWAEVVLSMEDAKLAETKWLPYNGGRDHSYLEMLEYVRWNATYHTGQVAYIQTLYGDKDMH